LVVAPRSPAQEEQVYVGGVVEFARAEFAERDD
jgi:hypothetical protein